MRATLRKTQLISQDDTCWYPCEGARVASLKSGGYCIMAWRAGGSEVLMGIYRSKDKAMAICQEIMYAVTEGKERYWLPLDY